jgi:hypothetical protein
MDCVSYHFFDSTGTRTLVHWFPVTNDFSETTVVVLITPPPVDEVGRRVYARSGELPERTNEVTKLYAQACKDVAKEAGVPVIDLWSLFQQTQNWQQAYLRLVHE